MIMLLYFALAPRPEAFTLQIAILEGAYGIIKQEQREASCKRQAKGLH